MAIYKDISFINYKSPKTISKILEFLGKNGYENSLFVKSLDGYIFKSPLKRGGYTNPIGIDIKRNTIYINPISFMDELLDFLKNLNVRDEDIDKILN